MQTTVCAGLGAGSWVSGLLADVGVPLEGIQEAIDSHRVVSCGRPPSENEEIGQPPQFQGGQCPIPYLAQYDFVQFDSMGNEIQRTPQINSVQGPVAAFNAIALGGSWCIQIDDAMPAAPACDAIIGASGVSFAFEGIVLTPTGGGQDNCGDLPGQPPAPISSHDDVLPPVEYDDDDGNPVQFPSLPIRFFKPCVNLDGLRIPFEIDLGFTKICGKAGIGFDIADFDVSPNIDIDVCPSQKEEIGIPQEDLSEFFELELVGTELTDPNFAGNLTGGLGEDESPILGVFIKAALGLGGLTSETVVIDNNPNAANLILPRIAEVTFEPVAEGENSSVSGFTEPIPVKNTQAFIPCPWPHGASSVRVVFSGNWTGGYYIARRKSCCDNCSANDPNAGLDNWDRCRTD